LRWASILAVPLYSPSASPVLPKVHSRIPWERDTRPPCIARLSRRIANQATGATLLVISGDRAGRTPHLKSGSLRTCVALSTTIRKVQCKRAGRQTTLSRKHQNQDRSRYDCEVQLLRQTLHGYRRVIPITSVRKRIGIVALLIQGLPGQIRCRVLPVPCSHDDQFRGDQIAHRITIPTAAGSPRRAGKGPLITNPGTFGRWRRVQFRVWSLATTGKTRVLDAFTKVDAKKTAWRCTFRERKVPWRG
jgi:hypothetical protein